MGWNDKSMGNVETVWGYVTNYDSKYNEDGSVECSVEILSKNGALISGNFSQFNTIQVLTFT